MRLSNRRDEAGLALFVTVLMLILMAGIAMAALDTISGDRQVAGLQNRSRSAFYAAEAAIAEARSLVRNVSSRTSVPTFYDKTTPKMLGDTALYDREGSLPRFYGDPDYAEPIRYAGESAGTGEGMNLSVQGQRLSSTLWQINVVGESAGGSKARIEVVEAKVMSKGY
jgi:Tfp pilus assembly protein PilX